MKRSLLDILQCPACRSDSPLALEVLEGSDEDVREGHLDCPDCGARYDIRGSIPRFVPPEDDYAGNFGFQWNKWKAVQIDHQAGHSLSTTRFFADSRWTPEEITGKLILDAGCGAGRFTDVAAEAGAHVVAIDLSNAIEACRDNTARHDGRVQCLQASVYALPFKPEVFEAIYCMGMLQHTPDPKATILALPPFARPGAKLAYNFYEEGIWRRLQVIKYALRLVTPHLPLKWTLGLSKGLCAVFFPLTRALSGVRKVRILNHFIPIAAVHPPELSREQQYTWTFLDTFDWYGPKYELRQNHKEVETWLKEVRLEDVESAPGLAWGRKKQCQRSRDCWASSGGNGSSEIPMTSIPAWAAKYRMPRSSE